MNRKDYKECLHIEIGKGFKAFLKSHFVCSYNAVLYIRKAQYYYKKGFLRNLLSKYYVNKLISKYGIFIRPSYVIGSGLKLPHPNGIIIGTNKIGKNCTIFQQVTIGSARMGDFKKGNQPIIGDNCIFFAGCKVLGSIGIADGTVVGANAVLTKDTEKNCTYVGVPAKKVIKE